MPKVFDVHYRHRPTAPKSQPADQPADWDKGVLLILAVVTVPIIAAAALAVMFAG